MRSNVLQYITPDPGYITPDPDTKTQVPAGHLRFICKTFLAVVMIFLIVVLNDTPFSVYSPYMFTPFKIASFKALDQHFGSGYIGGKRNIVHVAEP